MHSKQRTIKDAASFQGVGLHTGNQSTITFHPAPVDYGYRFVRADLPDTPEIPALVDHVVDISRGTTLAIDDVKVHTVEHVLAALAGLQIDNCRIELTANEPPVGDGSAMPYVEALQNAGIVEQDKARKYFTVTQPVRYTNDDKGVDIVALPTDDFRVTVMVDYQNPALGSQHTGLFDLDKEFLTEFAPARTFCFLTEVEALKEHGLIRGGTLDNAVVIVDKDMTDDELLDFAVNFGLKGKVVLGHNGGLLNNTTPRFKNEPARHKLLDMLGDLALAGVPLKAQILAARPGHASNIEFARLIRKLYLQTRNSAPVRVREALSQAEPVMDVHQILDVMPHRYPFLLVDRIVEHDTDLDRIIGLKNVTFNEPFFQGHFPGRPIMPGVLIVEAMAQVGGLLMLGRMEDVKKKMVFFRAIENAVFRKTVTPGDQLILDVKLTASKFQTFTLGARAYVGETLVAEANLRAVIVDR
jgi:UDP-3-O-[3-hydroxymyristoyl] N-acetylglucosamine deacetylase/3-hydroxyacyl-[acyl-carrier-protein] dehydratase